MTEWTKTSLFVAAAGVTVGLAAASATLTRPVAPKAFELVGEEFYPEFDNPLAARTLEVVTYDDETTAIKPFDVTWGEHGWSISPYGYPADAEDQLEKTAASVVGIERTGLASRRENDHERFGVIDPSSEDATMLKGRGSRITLKNEKGDVLADYILGEAVEDREGYFYVRKPKEKETYIARVDLKLSTRFADWIESDLLKVSSTDLQKIDIFDYSLDEDRGTIVGRDRSVLVRGDDFGPWTLEGLDETTEQINTANVNNLTRVLDELKIIGVRPKPKGLKPDLSLDTTVINNQLAADLLRENLADRGFFLAQTQEGALQLVAKEGQLTAVTKDGVAYDLFFGDQFTGSLFELEFGDAEDADRPKHLKKDDSKGSQTGRYVFIAARLEPAQLGEAPKPPGEPEPLPEDASEEDRKKAEAAAKKAKTDYETAKNAYDQTLADGKKRVEELNERFSDWYYVISTENFEDLRLSREALVEPKTTEPQDPAMEPKPAAESAAEGAAPAPVEAPKPAGSAQDTTSDDAQPMPAGEA
ncbi:MAG: DUF4340 domain-containing protein [Planctomycetaceae bacterium]